MLAHLLQDMLGHEQGYVLWPQREPCHIEIKDAFLHKVLHPDAIDDVLPCPREAEEVQDISFLLDPTHSALAALHVLRNVPLLKESIHGTGRWPLDRSGDLLRG